MKILKESRKMTKLSNQKIKLSKGVFDMKLSEKNIEKFYDTLIKIIEERENVKIKYIIKNVEEGE
jgi:hypothetical protein